MGHPRGKFRVRIRKMRPEPITIRRQQAWRKSEKKEETVLATIFISLICFKIFRVSRRNDEEEDIDDTPPSDPEQVQIEIGGDHTPGSTAGHGPIVSNGDATMADVSDRNHEYPNLIRVLEYIQSSSSLECMSSPLPGAIGEADPPSFVFGGGAATMAGPSSLPTLMSTQEVEQAHNAGDLELASLPSPEEQQKTKDKKKKKSEKSKSKNKKESKKQQAAGKSGKKVKSYKSKEDSSTSKILSVKEWAKQEEKKKKAEKKQQMKEIKQEKKKQKQMEKLASKAKKQKKAQKLKEEKESKKAEKEVAKAKKAAEKAAAKSKEAAAQAEAKRKEQQSKLALRMQQMLEESDKQMAADLERDRMLAEERKRKQEAKAREVLKSIAKTEQIIKTLQEKLDRKGKKIAQLSARRDRKRRISMLVAFKLNYKIADYNRKINSLSSVINKLNKKVEAKQKEVEKLAPHLLDAEVSTETQEDSSEANPCSSNSNDTDRTDDVAADNASILDMLSYFDSESECSDDEEEEVEEGELPTERSTNSNVQEILRKAQESLQIMDGDRRTKIPSVFFR